MCFRCLAGTRVRPRSSVAQGTKRAWSVQAGWMLRLCSTYAGSRCLMHRDGFDGVELVEYPYSPCVHLFHLYMVL